jgi:hypothetical protein
MKNAFIFIIGSFLINCISAQSEVTATNPKYFESIEIAEFVPNLHLQRQRFAEQHARMEMMKIWKLTEYLSLTEAQAEKFFPAMKKHEDDMEKLRIERNELEDEMMNRLNSSKEPLSQTILDEFLKAIETIEFQMYEEKNVFVGRLKNILLNKQVAKMAMFERHFRGEIRDRIRIRRNIDKPPSNRFN